MEIKATAASIANDNDANSGGFSKRVRTIHEIRLELLEHWKKESCCDVELYGKPPAKQSIDNEPFNRQLIPIKGGKVCTIDAIDHGNLTAIRDFIYTGKLRLPTALGNERGGSCDCLESVLMDADYLQMPKLVHFCGSSIIEQGFENSTLTNNADMWLFARKYHCDVLAAEAVCTTVMNLRMIDQTLFLKMTTDDAAALLKILVADSKCDPDLVCTNWLDFDEDERDVYVGQLVSENLRRNMVIHRFMEGLQLAVENTTFPSDDTLMKLTQINELRAKNEELAAKLTTAEEDRTERGNLIDKLVPALMGMVVEVIKLEGEMEHHAKANKTPYHTGRSHPFKLLGDADVKSRLKLTNDALLLIITQYRK